MSPRKIDDCGKHDDREGVGCIKPSMRRFGNSGESSHGGSQYDKKGGAESSA